jgi:UDP-galactose transporter B1
MALGLETPGPQTQEKGTHGNGKLNGHATNGAATKGGEHNHRERHPSNAALRQKGLMFRYFQCALFVTLAAPLGFAALAHISYPAMVLGKSCKLVPVMIMNVLLYRRKFAPHKYLVVAMVTAGITMFMFFGKEAEGKGKPKAKGKELASATDSIIGVFYLLVNLAIDGATNSTQDEIFARYRVTGQQMMFWMNVMCTLLTATLISLPLPYIPVLHPSSNGRSDLSLAMEFVREHPGIVVPLIQFAMTGALGQLFIFETLQHFGSLTLVYVTSFVHASADLLTPHSAELSP